MKRSILIKAVPFLVVCILTGPFFVRAADEDAPDITNVQVSDVTENGVTVTWTTDENADSLINYGLKEDYGIVRVPVVERKTHSITLEGLDAGRIYHFRVLSSDSEGNQGISADYKVKLEGTPQTGDGSADGSANADGQGQGAQAGNADTTSETPSETTVEEIQQKIQEITDVTQLQKIQNELVKAIEGITEDLTIVGPPTVVPETTTALVTWTTDRLSSSDVLFSPADQYAPNNYIFAQSSTGGDVSDHEVRLIGLEPFTEYHFKVRSTDSFAITGESRDYTFVTKASLPDIRNLRIVKVEEDAATLAWDTTVPAKATIEYQDLTTGIKNSKGRPTLATSHQMRIAGLTLGTRYVAFVIAENAGGDRVKSQAITFVTVVDTAAPIISNVTNESTLFPGSESRIHNYC